MAPLPSGMVLAIPLALLLGGCVTFTPDGGMAPVASRVSGDIGGQVVKITSEEEAATARARVSALLSRPNSALGHRSPAEFVATIALETQAV